MHKTKRSVSRLSLRRLAIVGALGCVVGILYPRVLTADPAVTESIGSAAVLLDRTRLNFPAEDWHQEETGWVRITYSVDRNSRVVDAQVADAAAPPALQRLALQSIRDWDYRAATNGGQPISQEHNEAVFHYGYTKGPIEYRRSYRTAYRSVEKFIARGKLDDAHIALDEMKKDAIGGHEETRASLLEAQISGAKGDLAAQGRHLQRAIIGNGRWIGKEAQFAAIRVLLAQAIRSNNAAQALQYYQQLSSAATSEVGAFVDIMAKVQTVVDADDAIATPLVIEADIGGGKGLVRQPLLRRAAVVTDVTVPPLTGIDIRCDQVRLMAPSMSASQNTIEWRLPPGEEPCELLVVAPINSTLTLIEIR